MNITERAGHRRIEVAMERETESMLVWGRPDGTVATAQAILEEPFSEHSCRERIARRCFIPPQLRMGKESNQS
jgi:hypothetical protein